MVCEKVAQNAAQLTLSYSSISISPKWRKIAQSGHPDCRLITRSEMKLFCATTAKSNTLRKEVFTILKNAGKKCLF
jgi:hypothetical protein